MSQKNSKRVKPNIFSLRTLCLVTGASKGLGKCISKMFASKFPSGSVIILAARSGDLLQKVKLEIEASTGDKIQVVDLPIDLTTLNEINFGKCIKDILDSAGRHVEDFEQSLIIHNAASLGDVSKKLSEIDNFTDLDEYYRLNITAVVTLNTQFLQLFPASAMKQRVVINISSICAIQPFKSWSMYCAGKAARDMLFRTMALEDPDIRVLNYAPGPLDTEMQVLARTVTGDEEIRNFFQEMHSDGKLLNCETSVKKFIKLLEENTFLSGAHIDYYDIP